VTKIDNPKAEEHRAIEAGHGRLMSEEYEPGLVSVIVPTFNRAGFLVEAMDSVYQQTYRPIELIVVDDGSTDDTCQVVDEWRSKYTGDNGFRLRYFFQENAGAPVARSFGMIESSGEFIQFLDSDDLLHPKRFERIIRVFEESSCDYVITGFDGFCGRCGQVIERHVPEASDDQLEVLCQGKLWGSTLQFAWRRDLAEQIGGWDIDMVAYQDYDFIIRTLLISRNSVAIQEILSHARRGGSTRISDIRFTHKGYESFLRATEKLCNGIKSLNLSPKSRKALAVQLYHKGVFIYRRYPDIGRRFGELAQSLGCSPDSILGVVERNIWRAGRMASAVYVLALRIKNRLSRLILKKTGARVHICPRSEQPRSNGE